MVTRPIHDSSQERACDSKNVMWPNHSTAQPQMTNISHQRWALNWTGSGLWRILLDLGWV